MFGCPYYEVPVALDGIFFEAFEDARSGFEATGFIKKMKTIVHAAIKNGHKSRVLPHIEVTITRMNPDQILMSTIFSF